MSRVNVRGNGKYSMAFGVDHLPDIGAFVMIWNHEIDREPYDEGEEGGTNIVVHENNATLGGFHLSEERVVELARQYDIPIDPHQVWQVFD